MFPVKTVWFVLHTVLWKFSLYSLWKVSPIFFSGKYYGNFTFQLVCSSILENLLGFVSFTGFFLFVKTMSSVSFPLPFLIRRTENFVWFSEKQKSVQSDRKVGAVFSLSVNTMRGFLPYCIPNGFSLSMSEWCYSSPIAHSLRFVLSLISLSD